MTDSKTICDFQRVDRFLQNEMGSTEAQEFEDHLTRCEPCRHQVTDSAADESLWKETQRHLSHSESPADAKLNDFTETLSFLNPSEDPRMLGRFGGYEIAGVIGQGGMGVVLKGFDPSLNRYVAIKVLAPQLATRRSARDRFAREAQAAAAVVHDNVVAIHGVSEAAGLPYLVMPYLRGESLQKRLDRDGAMSTLEILRIAHQIASGLAAAHAQGLVHRDIKPANILLPEGVQRVLIMDFGLARAVDDSNLTGSGTIAGTPQFMSPEQARGESIHAKSDLFSLGSVLYYMCTGRSPFRASNSFGILKRIVEDQPRPIREINVAIPDWLENLVGRLHTKSPDERYPDAAQLASLLENCLAHVQNPSIPIPKELSAESTARRVGWWAALAMVGMLTLFGATLVPNTWFGKQDAVGEGAAPVGAEPSPFGTDITWQDQGRQPADRQLTPEIVAQFASEPVTDLTPLSVLRGRWQFDFVKKDGEGIPVRDWAALQSQPGSARWPFPIGDLEFRDDQVVVKDRYNSKELMVRNVEVEPSDSAIRMLWSDPDNGASTHAFSCTYSTEFGLAHSLVMSISSQGDSGTAEFEFGFKRLSNDALVLRNQAELVKSVIKSYYEQGDDALYPFCQYLFTLAESQLREADLRERVEVLSRELNERLGEQHTETAELEKQAIAHLQSQAQAERAKRMELVELKQSEIRFQDQLKTLTDRITSLQKEGNHSGAEEVKLALLSLLQSEDKDYDRLSELRQQMIELRLQGNHDAADAVVQEIDNLESRLNKRYLDVDRHNEVNGYWEDALRMHHLAKDWRAEGKDAAADRALEELEILKGKIIEEFGSIAWTVFAAENLEPIDNPAPGDEDRRGSDQSQERVETDR